MTSQSGRAAAGRTRSLPPARRSPAGYRQGRAANPSRLRTGSARRGGAAGPAEGRVPTRPRVACADPGCPNTRPCPDHPARTWAGKPMPPGWKATRRRILARDGHRCRACGATEALEVHHTIPGAEADETLVTLCRPCHRAITAAQALAGRQASRPLTAAAAWTRASCTDRGCHGQPGTDTTSPARRPAQPCSATRPPSEGLAIHPSLGGCWRVIPTPTSAGPDSAEKSRVAHERRGRMVDLRRHHRCPGGTSARPACAGRPRP
jgi:5-methylcytosine-specific restriction endonuclease McrA